MVNNSQWRDLERFWQHEADINPRDALSAFKSQHGYDVSSWSLKFVNYTLEVMMARGKSAQSPVGEPSGNQWTTFVDIPLTGILMKDVEHAFGDVDNLVDCVAGMCEHSYRFGISFNQANDAFIVSVTCRDADSPNSGKTFTAFAETWYQALQVAVYKHYILAMEKWPEKGVRPNQAKFG